MKATKAKELRRECVNTVTNNVLEDIYIVIENKSKLGWDSINYSLKPHNESLIDTSMLIKKLKEDGYRVTHDKGSDDDGSWNTLGISWEEK
jgi:hypothetical protein